MLWGVFALLLLFSGIRLLFACALTLPSFLHLNFCPATLDVSALARENEIRHALERRMHQAQIALARIAPCTTCTPAPATLASVPQEFAMLLDISDSMTEGATDINKQPIHLQNGALAKKIDIVKRDLPPALDQFRDKQVMYMAFRFCQETRATVRETGSRLAQRIRSMNLNPIGGTGSPMGSVLREAAAAFHPGPDGRYNGNILLVNAGTLECVTKATGGRFFARGSAVDLRQMLQDATTFGGSACVENSSQPNGQRNPR
jgi:hypothetical protein